MWEPGAKECTEPQEKVREYIKTRDFQGAIEWLDEFMKKVLEKHKDNFSDGVSVETFPRVGEISFRYCNEKRKEELKSRTKELLERELTDFAFKQEGGMDSILGQLDKKIDEKFASDLLEIAEDCGSYDDSVRNFIYAAKSEEYNSNDSNGCIRAMYDALKEIHELEEFHFDVWIMFTRELIHKYKKMSPKVELSFGAGIIENDKKRYPLIIKNSSVIPMIKPRLELDIKTKRYKDGEIIEKSETARVPIILFLGGKEAWNYFTVDVSSAVKLEPVCEKNGYLYILKLTMPNTGPVAYQINGKVIYEEPFLKRGERKISSKEEVKSDNYLGDYLDDYY